MSCSVNPNRQLRNVQWVPKILTDDQKRSRLDNSWYFLSRYEDDPEEFIDRVVTQDESWVHLFDPACKKQSIQWKHLGSPTPKIEESFFGNASIFWDKQGIIMVSYPEESRTINGAYYAEELRRLRQEMARKKRGKLIRGVLLLQDNAPAHTSQVAMAAATECGFKVLPYPPYSLDLAPKSSLDCSIPLIPILLYASEVWGIYGYAHVDKVQIKFCQNLLNS